MADRPFVGANGPSTGANAVGPFPRSSAVERRFDASFWALMAVLGALWYGLHLFPGRQQVDTLLEKRAALRTEVTDMRRRYRAAQEGLRALQRNDPLTWERVARTRLGWVAPGEVLSYPDDPPSAKEGVAPGAAAQAPKPSQPGATPGRPAVQQPPRQPGASGRPPPAPTAPTRAKPAPAAPPPDPSKVRVAEKTIPPSL